MTFHKTHDIDDPEPIDTSRYFFKDFTAQSLLTLPDPNASFISVTFSSHKNPSYLLIIPSQGIKYFTPPEEDVKHDDIPFYEKVAKWDLKNAEFIWKEPAGQLLAYHGEKCVFVTLYNNSLLAFSVEEGKIYSIPVEGDNTKWTYPADSPHTFKAKWSEKGEHFSICDGSRFAVFALTSTALKCVNSEQGAVADVSICEPQMVVVGANSLKFWKCRGDQQPFIPEGSYNLNAKYVIHQCEFIRDHHIILDTDDTVEDTRVYVFLNIVNGITEQYHPSFSVNAEQHRRIFISWLPNCEALVVFKEEEEAIVFQQGKDSDGSSVWQECIMETTALSLPFESTAQILTMEVPTRHRVEHQSKEKISVGPTYFIVVKTEEGATAVVCASFCDLQQEKGTWYPYDSGRAINPYGKPTSTSTSAPSIQQQTAEQPSSGTRSFSFGSTSNQQPSGVFNFGGTAQLSASPFDSTGGSAKLSSAQPSTGTGGFSFGSTSNQQPSGGFSFGGTGTQKASPSFVSTTDNFQSSSAIKKSSEKDQSRKSQQSSLLASPIKGNRKKRVGISVHSAQPPKPHILSARRDLSQKIATADTTRTFPKPRKTYDSEFGDLERSIETFKEELADLAHRARESLPKQLQSSLHLPDIATHVLHQIEKQTQLKRELVQIEKDYQDTLHVINWRLTPMSKQAHAPTNVSSELQEMYHKIEKKFSELESIVEESKLRCNSPNQQDNTSTIHMLNTTIQSHREHLELQKSQLKKLGGMQEMCLVRDAQARTTSSSRSGTPLFSRPGTSSTSAMQQRYQRKQVLVERLAQKPPVTTAIRSSRLPPTAQNAPSAQPDDDDDAYIPPKYLRRMEQLLEERSEALERSIQERMAEEMERTIQERVAEEVSRSMQDIQDMLDRSSEVHGDYSDDNSDYENDEDDYPQDSIPSIGRRTVDSDHDNDNQSKSDKESELTDEAPSAGWKVPLKNKSSDKPAPTPSTDKDHIEPRQFAFGGSSGSAVKSAAPGFDASTLDKESSKPPTFSFGSSTASAEPAKSFDFGSTKGTTSFSFGDFNAPKQPAKDETESAPPSKPTVATPQPSTESNPFTTGKRIKKSSTTAEASDVKTDAPSTPTKANPFSFGTPSVSKVSTADKEETSSSSTFSFGTPSVKKLAPTIPDKDAAPAFTFGGNDKSKEATSKLFGFGSTNETTDTKTSPTKESSQAFSFGSETAKPSNAAFSFGSTEAAKDEPKKEETPAAGTFSFGAKNDELESSQPAKETSGAFSFGGATTADADKTTKPESSAFSFGDFADAIKSQDQTKAEPSTSAPSFLSGPSLESAFDEMVSSTPQPNSNFSWDNANFGASEPPKPTTDFSLGGSFGSGFGSQTAQGPTDNSSTWANTATNNNFSWQMSNAPAQSAMQFNVQPTDDSTSSWKDNFASAGSGDASSFFASGPTSQQSAGGFGSGGFSIGNADTNSSGFGSSGGGFGSSSFGQSSNAAPAFGASTFGQSTSDGFGAHAFGSAPQQQAPIATDGGFGSFSSQSTGFGGTGGSGGWI